MSPSVLPAPAEIQADLSRYCLTYLCYETIECVKVNAMGRTPLDIAALFNASAVAGILIEHGALTDESLHLAYGVKGSRVASVLI